MGADAEGEPRGSPRRPTPQEEEGGNQRTLHEEVASAAVRDRVEALAAEMVVEPGGEAALAASNPNPNPNPNPNLKP